MEYRLTEQAARQLQATRTNPADLVDRVLKGHWGDIPFEDRVSNEAALRSGKGKVLSCLQLDLCDPMLVAVDVEDHSADIRLLREAFY